jgi:hypothetical protein
MLHPTYKHLEDRIRLAGLSLAQWVQLFACALAAYGLAQLLPLPGSWSLSVAISVCGLPAACAIAFQQAEFDVRRWLLDALRFPARRGAFRPGLGELSDVAGYRLAPDETYSGLGSGDREAGIDVEALWDAR